YDSEADIPPAPGYSPDGGYPATPPDTTPSTPQTAPEVVDVGKLLTAFGVPNDDGRLFWPEALRNLTPATESRELRVQLNALFQVALSQTPGSAMASNLRLEGTRAVARLRTMLQGMENDLTAAKFAEGDRFLRKLDEILALLT